MTGMDEIDLNRIAEFDVDNPHLAEAIRKVVEASEDEVLSAFQSFAQ